MKNFLSIAAVAASFALYIIVCSNGDPGQTPKANSGAELIEPPGQSANSGTDEKTRIPSDDSNIRRLLYISDGNESDTVQRANFDQIDGQPRRIANPYVGEESNASIPSDVYPHELTKSQVETLKSLPSACVSDLPGIEGIFEANQQNTWPESSFRPNGGNSKIIDNTRTRQDVSQTSFVDAENLNSTQSVLDPKTRPLNEQVSQTPFSLPLPLSSNPNYSNSNSQQRTHAHSPGQPARVAGNSNLPAWNGNGRTNQSAYNPHASASAHGTTSTLPKSFPPGEDPHAGAFSRTAFPSASECRQCHEQIYDEWASSSHAYASVSPMFSRFEDTINKLSQGTIGYFCLRCHAPVATTMGLRRDQAIWDGPKVFREGVTCVACHRVKEAYNKADGERRIEPGDINEPVYGSANGLGVEQAIKYKDFFKVKPDRRDKGPGQPIHRRGIQFEQLSKSDFCMSCHQVAVKPGIKLEVVWDQYRGSPAYREGITCQECHMGKVPGMAEGYTVGPAAVMTGKVVNPERKHSNHVFYGPGYSIAHPGIFPQNPAADRWTFNQWLTFDWRAGWGTDDFEDKIADGMLQHYFPPEWRNPDDRYDAREIVDANLKKLTYKKDLRRQVMENGSKLEGPYFAESPGRGRQLKFHYCVTNTNPGHNMPSGSLGAQPQLWLNVVLIGPDGNRLWESGYLDSQGDLADLHSLDVASRKVPLDKQLFNLQTKFLTTNVKGTDREMYLPVNFDIDQLPFLRPAPQPVSVINHPPFIRMESHSIPPLGSRKAKYVIPSHLMKQPGTYRLSARMRSRAEPIYFMNFVKATPEMKRMMNEWICDIHPYTVTFEVK